LNYNFSPPYLGDSESLIGYIPCSSGTTGLSKGICITHAQMIDPNVGLFRIIDGSFLYFTSLYWISSVMCIMRCFFDGYTVITTTKKFSTDVCIDIFEKYRPSGTFLPCRYLADLLRNPRFKTADLSSLSMVFTGGSPLNEKLRSDFDEHLPNGKVGFGYGLSEVGGMVTSDLFGSKPGSCGLLGPNTRVKVVDDEGNKLGIGERGEIIVKNNCPVTVWQFFL
jgi:acyl-coenzyme A synthetase/AMP-(fatty) acid ligase